MLTFTTRLILFPLVHFTLGLRTSRTSSLTFNRKNWLDEMKLGGGKKALLHYSPKIFSGESIYFPQAGPVEGKYGLHVAMHAQTRPWTGRLL